MIIRKKDFEALQDFFNWHTASVSKRQKMIADGHTLQAVTYEAGKALDWTRAKYRKFNKEKAVFMREKRKENPNYGR